MLKNKIISAGLLFISLLLYACSGNPDKANQPEISKYIYGYTSGTITSSSPIVICLEQSPGQQFQAGESLPENLLKISPATKGRLHLKNDRTLEFTPEERWKNGEEYQFTLNLGELMDVPADYRYFKFKVRIIDLKATFSPGHLSVSTNNDTLQYESILYSSDYMEAATAENLVSAIFNKEKRPIEWQHHDNTHRILIKHLAKGDNGRTLTLRFGSKVTNNDDLDIAIPGKSDFTVLNMQLNGDDRQSVRIDMSENIAPDQDLNGLVTIKGVSGIRYKIEKNSIYLYYEIQEDKEILEVSVQKGIRSTEGHKTTIEYTQTIHLPSSSPGVKFIGEGVIVPADGKVLIPFSAVALKAVDLQIIKVFSQNMNFFLQQNSYTEAGDLMRTARPVFRKKIELQKEGEIIDLGRWNDFTLNLSDYTELEKGVIYRIEIRFKKSYTTLECADSGEDIDYYQQNWDGNDYYYSDYYYSSDYQWEERDNPCSDSYYTGNRFISKNIINTSLGIIAKRGIDNIYFVAVNDIATARPVANCSVILYNYQNQRIDSATTDKNGFANLQTKEKAFIVQAQKDKDKAWLKISDANTLSLSNFDVSGQDVQSGLKGFIYGERGVWRPGDDIWLSFILEDRQEMLPEGHPVTAQLTDPKGNIIQTRKSVIGKSPIYCFKFSTEESAPTGYWNAQIRIGGTTFNKTLRIETIKPNRLSIDMVFPNEQIIGKGLSGSTVRVNTRWLTGAGTSGLKAITEVRLNPGNYPFKSFPDYSFQDLSKDFEPYSATLFDGNTDKNGSFSFSLDKLNPENAPGVLNATFTTRVFENGGDFSISSYTTAYSPYTQYVGISLPKADGGWYPTRQPVKLNGVVVNPTGQKTTGTTSVDLKVYEISWRWWWDSGNNSYGTYVNRSYDNLAFEKTVQSQGGSFSADLNIPEYGRYYIQATDRQSGHTTELIAYFGSWAEQTGGDMATILNISTDKQNYKTGEKIKVNIPSSADGVAIVSLENGASFGDIRRIPAKEGSTSVEFEATSSMCPNIYVAVTLLQPQKNRSNDRPVRLYGVVNVNVEDASLHLEPVIKMDKELRPAKEFTVSVSEKDHRAMDYTIAIVDEGLLSLTSFRTPQPFPAFYAREALGVKTWDFYDYIFGAFGARLEKAFAIGGDEALKPLQDEKTNRFKPVVLFDGPYHLDKGKTQTHKFRMPEYIGEVRAMIVAATRDGKYGSANASAQVKKPLMISVAMPRSFTPGDLVEIPVTVFAMNDNIKEVSLNIQADNKISIEGNSTCKVTFSGKGEKLAWFKFRIKENTGNTTLTFTANSGQEQASEKITAAIRVPNPRITKVTSRILKAGETTDFSERISGADPASILEISSIPPLNLGERLNDLITYPYGCAEQITSAAFPQISLGQLLELSPRQKNDIENNVKTVINRLSLYQTQEGGFAYWPGEPYTSEWASTYVTDFLVCASGKGYNIPSQLLQKGLNYLKTTANNYRINDYYDEAQQGYRLYVLALAGKPDLAAMNRMKERTLQNNTAQWLLASAYALCNHPDISRKLIRDASRQVSPYRETGRTFGSDIRDQAIMLQTMVYLNMQEDAFRMLEKISAALSSGEWMSTQTTAFALIAATAYVEKFVGSVHDLDITIKTSGNTDNIRLNKTVFQQPLTVRNEQSSVQITNNSKSSLYTRVINSSAPLQVFTERIMSGLSMNIVYLNDAGKPVNIEQIPQGTDITAEISIKNTGITGRYENLVLNYMLPSGFEIINDRLTGNTNAFREADYADIRDDRYYIYFSLDQNQTKTFRFRFNAAFPGDYIRPAIRCGAMYDNRIEAVLPGGKVLIRQTD